MLATGRVKMGGSEEKSEQEHRQQNFFVSTYDIELHKTCYQEVSRCCRAKQRQRNVQKNGVHVLIRPMDFLFAVLVAFALLALNDFIFCFELTVSVLTRASLLVLVNSIYYQQDMNPLRPRNWLIGFQAHQHLIFIQVFRQKLILSIFVLELVS